MRDRADKPFAAEGVSEAIQLWMEERQDLKRPVNVRELYEHQVEELEYASSYRSVLRYVRRHFPTPRMRTWRRVETPAGAQSQTDWGQYRLWIRLSATIRPSGPAEAARHGHQKGPNQASATFGLGARLRLVGDQAPRPRILR